MRASHAEQNPERSQQIHRAIGAIITIGEHCIPAMKASMPELDRSADVFSWDPI